MPDFATTDLALAIAHHLLIFAIAAIIAFELGVIRINLTSRDIARLARVDLWYCVLAGAIIAVGFTRAVFAAKGWAYYSVNLLFWAKIGTFAIIGLLSIAPTLAIMRWRKGLAANPGFLPTPEQIGKVRRFLWAEVALFALLPIFAAAMTRGYGSL